MSAHDSGRTKYGTAETITPEQRLMLIGLLTLAADHRKSLEDIERSVATIIGEPYESPGCPGCGRSGDFVWSNEGSADVLLEREGITVERT
jgi:hypothetical protein